MTPFLNNEPAALVKKSAGHIAVILFLKLITE